MTSSAMTAKVVEAAERTMASGTARVTCRWAFTAPWMQMWTDFRRRGPIFLKPVARMMLSAAEKTGETRTMVGWVDFDGRRYAPRRARFTTR